MGYRTIHLSQKRRFNSHRQSSGGRLLVASRSRHIRGAYRGRLTTGWAMVRGMVSPFTSKGDPRISKTALKHRYIFDFRFHFAYCVPMLSRLGWSSVRRCHCVIVAFARDPQLEHGTGEAVHPPQSHAYSNVSAVDRRIVILGPISFKGHPSAIHRVCVRHSANQWTALC